MSSVACFQPSSDYKPVGVAWLGDSGIKNFLRREVLPYAPDSVKIGYEVSFIRYFYKPPMRSLEDIQADILEMERLLGEIIGGV